MEKGSFFDHEAKEEAWPVNNFKHCFGTFARRQPGTNLIKYTVLFPAF
jgi:hypothetical protein